LFSFLDVKSNPSVPDIIDVFGVLSRLKDPFDPSLCLFAALVRFRPFARAASSLSFLRRACRHTA